MRWISRLLLLNLSIVTILFYFTNCGGMGAQNSGLDELGSTCAGISCGAQSENLRLNAVDSISVRSAVPYTDLDGSCNEAGFPGNVVIWQIILNGQVVKQCGQGQCGACVGGRYRVYVDFLPWGPSAEMSLAIELLGYDSSGKQHSNPLWARKVVRVSAF